MNEFLSRVDKMCEKSVLVVGDAILDKTVCAKAVGLSLETPTLKAEKISSEVTFGGAANVVSNCLELGADCHFLTVLGNDEFYQKYEGWECDKLATSIVLEDQRENVAKTRYWVNHGDGSYKYLQINAGDKNPIIDSTQKRVLDIFANIVGGFDVVLLVDYQSGIFCDEIFTQKMIKIAKEQGTPVISSSQKSTNDSRHSWFRGSDLISMNRDEARANDESFHDDLSSLRGALDSAICVTAGNKGSYITSEKTQYFCEAVPVDVRDTCGAGDAFLACISLQDWKNNPYKSLKLSNIWAALSVTKAGTTIPSKEELYKITRELIGEERKE